MFTLGDDNRQLNLSKHKKLLESMRKYGFLPCFPIVCRGGGFPLLVKDGQHRLKVAEQLELEVHYVEEDADFDVAEINNTAKAWQLRDYAEVYARQGNPHYAEALNFSEGYHMPLSLTAAMLGGCVSFSAVQPSFTDGTYVVKDREWAHKVVNVYLPLCGLSPTIKSTRFLDACMACCRVEDFDISGMISRAERQRHKLLPYATRDAYLGMMEEVYNFHRKQLFGLKSAAIQAMRERNAIVPKETKAGKT
jgi:hypothetical protein